MMMHAAEVLVASEVVKFSLQKKRRAKPNRDSFALVGERPFGEELTFSF